MCDVLSDLVPFVQYKKHEKNPWKSVTFSKVQAFLACNFTKSNTPPWVFFAFFKLYKGNESLNAKKIIKEIALEVFKTCFDVNIPVDTWPVLTQLETILQSCRNQSGNLHLKLVG